MEDKLSKESRKVPATPGLFSTLTSFLLVLLFSTWVVAESPQPAATHPLTNQEDAIPAVTPLSKVSSDLLKMRTLSQGPDAGQSLKNILPETKNWIVYQDGNPVLEFYLNTTDEKRVNEVVFHLQSLGCSIKGVYGRYGRIYGTCDLNLLDQIAANDAISLFRVATSLAFDPRSQTGAF